MITIISDDTHQNIGQKINNEFVNRGIKSEYISIAEVTVNPCVACGGCTYKSFGKCVTRDDGDWIYPKLIRSDKIVVVTPILWGCYSFKTKRVMDKCALIGDRYYYVKHKELIKGMQGNLKEMYVIGVKDNCSAEEKQVFTGLISENISIMNIKGNSFVVSLKPEENEITKMVEEISL